MGLHKRDLPKTELDLFRQGTVIPAHPLALTADREFDQRRQKALSRYYIDAGAGGLAVGVYTTQFAMREIGLYEPVLGLAAETAREWNDAPVFMIAGIAGKTEQATKESDVAVGLGYHAGLLNVSAMKGSNEDEVLEHCRKVADKIPLIGFYLLPEVGGIPLSSDFWRQFSQIDNVVGIKIAPFNRYGTVDVVRGVFEANAENDVTLYTGNDDHIILDLLTPYIFDRGDGPVTIHMTGGLLGHWCFWTRRAVETLARVKKAIASGVYDADLMALDPMTTDANGAIYDGGNDLKGCIPGCHDILRRQGLLDGVWCLNHEEILSPGQKEEIDRVYSAYPELNDDEFVAANLDRWLTD